MKTLRLAFWFLLLAAGLMAYASARGQIVFGNPVDTAKVESDRSSGVLSSNNWSFDTRVIGAGTAPSASGGLVWTSWVANTWTLITNCPATWSEFNYRLWFSYNNQDWNHLNDTGYPYPWTLTNSEGKYPLVERWQPIGTTYGGIYLTNSVPIWFALECVIKEGVTVVADLWVGTNVIGQTEVAPTNWVKSFGGSGTDGGSSVAVDTNGNTYIAGYFADTITVGSTVLTATGSQNMLLAKYNANGVVQWVKRYGLGTETPVGIALDSIGNIFVEGSTSSGLTDLSGATTNNGPNYLTNGVVWIAKYSTNGTYVWGKSYGGTMSASGLAVDSSGNVICAGVLGATADLGGGPIYPWGYDAFILKLDTSGNYVWSVDARSVNDVECGGVAVDGAGNVFVAGKFKGSVNWGIGDSNSVSAISYSAYLSKLNSSGVCQWQNVYGEVYGVSANGVATDGAGNVYMTGTFYWSCDFGSGTMTPQFGWNAYLAKYTTAGAGMWSLALYGGATPTPLVVTTDSGNNVWLGGYFNYSVNGFQVGGGGSPLMSAGGQTAFLSKYNSGGTNLWAAAYGGPFYTYAGVSGLKVDSAGSALGAGYFYQTATFGATVLNSQGGYDGFILRQHP